MIEENTFQMEPDEPSLKEVLGDDVSDEERRRLEWAGIHSVSQLRELQQSGEHVIEQVVQIPAMRLRAALERASRPHVSRIVPVGVACISIHGRSRMRETPPTVRVGGEPVTVLQASAKEILAPPLAHQMSGTLSVETAPGLMAEMAFDLNAERHPVVQPMAPTNGTGGQT